MCRVQEPIVVDVPEVTGVQPAARLEHLVGLLAVLVVPQKPVPRVFEKVFNAASQKAGTGLRGRIFANAVRHFEDWSKMESEHKHPSLAMRMKHSFYMSTVATSFRSALGPNLRYLASR